MASSSGLKVEGETGIRISVKLGLVEQEAIIKALLINQVIVRGLYSGKGMEGKELPTYRSMLLNMASFKIYSFIIL